MDSTLKTFFISLILLIQIFLCQIPQTRETVFLTFWDHRDVTEWLLTGGEEDQEDSVAQQQTWPQPAIESLGRH